LSTDDQLNHSYIYLLADVQNANIGQLQEFMDHDTQNSALDDKDMQAAVETLKMSSFKHRAK